MTDGSKIQNLECILKKGMQNNFENSKREKM